MSYSRWSNSCWYIWWDTSSGKDLLSQVLCAAGTLKHSVNLTFLEVYTILRLQDFSPLRPTGLLDADGQPQERETLEECLREFIKDALYDYDEEYRRIKQAEYEHWESINDLRRAWMTRAERDAEDAKLERRALDAATDYVRAKIREPSAARNLLSGQ